MAKRELEELSGVVESTNEKGVKVGGEWRNWSKYCKDRPTLTRGQAVTLLMDGDFVMGVAGGNNGSAAHEQDFAPRQVAQSGGAAPSNDRERLIVRQSSLKAAVDLAAAMAVAGDPMPSSEDVLRVAARFEKWVMREGE